MSPDRDQALSLRTVLVVLRRRLPILLICLIGVPASALAFSLLQEKQYTADASLLFRDPGFDQKLFGSTFLQPSRDPDREAATNIELLSVEAVAARTARALGGRLTPDEVAQKVDVVGKGQSDVASVRATDADPQFAAQLANTFAHKFIAFRQDADRAKVREARQLVQRQLDALTPTEMSGPLGRSIRERSEQLDVLASLQTGNAELVQEAEVPHSPSSPNTVRNIALGIVLGLMLGVGLAFLLERLDRRVRDPKEFEELFERPLLASIPDSRALAGGGPARHRGLPPQEQEAFRMLRANLRYFSVDRPVRSVLVTSAAPGDGKSTVSWQLALAAAGAGTRVLLMEADLRHPSLASSADELAASPGLSTVLAGQIEFAEAVQTVTVSHDHGGRAPERTMDVVVAGPLPPNPVDLIESERMRTVLHEAEKRYDLIVMDTPPASVVSDVIPLIHEVSGVIVVTRLGKSTRESLSHLRKQLENLNAPILGLVVNALKPDSRAYGYGYGYEPSEPQPIPGGNGASYAAEAGESAERAGR
jgi:polysaccharide biosynthesis transport protein